MGCVALGLTAATQYVAWAFGFHPNLGPPWFTAVSGSGEMLRAVAAVVGVVGVIAMGGGLVVRRLRSAVRFVPGVLFVAAVLAGVGVCESANGTVVVYGPLRFLGWGLAYGGFEEASAYYDLFTRGLLVGGGALSFALVAVLAARRSPEPLVSTGSQGTAAWSDGREFVGEEGVMIGRQLVSESGKSVSRKRGGGVGPPLGYAGDGHLITVAPTRSGKGTGSVIPNLLTYPGSVVVTDPKGENYAVTARHRARMGQSVCALDPFDQLGAMARAAGRASGEDAMEVVRATYNPMDLIDPYGEDWLESAALLAEMLVLPSGGKGEEAFWNEEAKGLLSGLILYVAAAELDEEMRPTERRTLARVRELLTLPQREFKALMDEMVNSSLCGGLVRRAAARHLQKEDRERSGVVSTAQSHTHFLDSPRMAEAMGSSSLDLRRLRSEGVSLYLVLPAHHLDTYARWLRLVVACGLHELARSPGKPTVDGQPRRVLFLLDEFAHLGRMNPVLRAFGLMAGFGVQVWAFLQDLSQLKATYPDRWGTFLANADVLQAFGTNDHETARYLSELTGEATVWAPTAGESLSRSRGKHAARSQGASQSFAERGRRLLTPDEVRRLPREEQLLFVKGTRPIRARKADYLVDPEFVGRRGGPLFDENPMHVAGDIGERARPPIPTLVASGDGAFDPPAEPAQWVDEWVFDEDDLPDFLREPGSPGG
jgi:type IV secretion system protein VirD4